MPEEEDYELVPHQTLAKVKHELDLLKQKAASKKSIPSKSLRESIEKLNLNVNNLLSLFKEAAVTMKTEEVEPGLKEQIDPLIKKIDKIEEENKLIAQGILVVADIVKELKEQDEEIKKKIEAKPIPAPKIMPPLPMPRMQMPPEPRPFPPAQRFEPRPFPPEQRFEQMPPFAREVPPSFARPIPPPGPMIGPSPLPPFPDLKSAPKKGGVFSRFLKKR